MVDGDSREWIAFPQELSFERQMDPSDAPQWQYKAQMKPEKYQYSSRRPPTPPSNSIFRRSSSQPAFFNDEERDSHPSGRMISGSLRSGPCDVVVTRNAKPLSLAEPDRTYSSTSSGSTSDDNNNNMNGRDRSSPSSARVSAQAQARGRGRETSKPKIPSQVARSLSRTRTTNTIRGRSASRKDAKTQGTASTKKTSSDANTGRSRSQSQSRPPSTRNNKKPGSASGSSRRSRSRSRSKSLTRVTGPSPLTSIRGHSPRPASRKPPSTLRTRQEMMQQREGSNRSLGGSAPGSRRAYTISDDGSYMSPPQSDNKIGQDIITFVPSNGRQTRPKVKPTKSGMMEKLFGDQVKKIPKSPPSGTFNYEVRPRILLAATVYHNTATNLWVTTINTNQRGVARDPATANRYLKAFSFATEKAARESAIANAPPKMIPFADAPCCFMCKGKFAVFRRASHCRNCGVCVCPSCTTSWSAKCVPDTYNLKKEANVKVCLACNSLSTSFKKALVDGDYEEAVALYGTGNINLRTQFPLSGKKEEIMFPIHCAAEGGNLDVLRWLLDDHNCPYKIIPSNRSTKSRNSPGVPILTSKGRSMLSIAVDGIKVDVMHYLVAECGISVYECSDIKSALRALEATLVCLPPIRDSGRLQLDEIPDFTRWDKASFDELSEPSTLGLEGPPVHDSRATGGGRPSSVRTRGSHKGGELCFLCAERNVDRLAMACGHQSCCKECSSTLVSCPVCNIRSDFVETLRP